MSHYKPYQDCRESGIEWIGHLPSHWKMIRLGKIAIERCDGPFGSGLKSEHYQQDGVRVIRLQNIGWAAFKDGDAAFIAHDHWSEALGNGHSVLPDDLLIAGLGDQNNPLGRACVAPATLGDALVKADCYRFRLNKQIASPQFVAMALSATAAAECGYLATGATRDRLNLELASGRRVPLPPVEEQAEIVEFLDRETARIDALIAKKTRFVELLKEKILALASQSPNSHDVEQVRLSRACDVISRPVQQEEGQSYTKLGLFNRGRGIFKKDATDTEDMGDSDFFWIQSEDLILSGQFAWEGAVALATEEHAGCVVSHRFPVIRGRKGVALTEYLFAYFLTHHGDFILNDCSRGSAGRNRPLNINTLLNWSIPVPPMQVQKKIADLVHLHERINTLSLKTVSLLKERRSALVTAAVTGQIDLREEV